jgi:midasin
LEVLDSNAHRIENPEAQEAFTRTKMIKKKTKAILDCLDKTEDAELIAEIKALKEDLNCVFEWHDGILVEAMEQGGLLLIDEISLANDSVLERLNSVFEQDRVLMVTEKSSREAIKIVAHEKFNMVATMNPSGDFGKKELSPALRNRMTEIWVESYFQ